MRVQLFVIGITLVSVAFTQVTPVSTTTTTTPAIVPSTLCAKGGACMRCETNAANVKYCTNCFEMGLTGSIAAGTSQCAGSTPIANCLTTGFDANGNQACLACRPGYYAASAANNFPTSCQLIPATVAHCATAVNQAGVFLCLVCLDGYSLVNGVCSALTHDVNCRYNGNPGSCSACKDGFGIALGTSNCAPSKYPGCAKWDAAKNYCIECDSINGYSANDVEKLADGSLNQKCGKVIGGALVSDLMKKIVDLIKASLDGVLAPFKSMILGLFGMTA